jgi:hypothetical protein
LFFNGHLALFDAEDLKEDLIAKCGTPHSFTGLEEDLIKQIIIAAHIAARKYRLFIFALYSTAFSLGFAMLYISWRII